MQELTLIFFRSLLAKAGWGTGEQEVHPHRGSLLSDSEPSKDQGGAHQGSPDDLYQADPDLASDGLISIMVFSQCAEATYRNCFLQYPTLGI